MRVSKCLLDLVSRIGIDLAMVPGGTFFGAQDVGLASSPQPPDDSSQSFSIEYEQEEDGRWLAEVPTLPGVMAYGESKKDAEVGVMALALRVMADLTSDGG